MDTVWYIVKEGVYLCNVVTRVVMVGDGIGEAYKESKPREFTSQEEAAEWLAASEFAGSNAEVTNTPPPLRKKGLLEGLSEGNE